MRYASCKPPDALVYLFDSVRRLQQSPVVTGVVYARLSVWNAGVLRLNALTNRAGFWCVGYQSAQLLCIKCDQDPPIERENSPLE